MRSTTFVAVLAIGILCVAGVASADPLDGQVLKFRQQAMVATQIGDGTGTMNTYFGHDELSQANLVSLPSDLEEYRGEHWVADDFSDQSNLPVVHVKWAGSYIGAQPESAAGQGADHFLIEFLSDKPDPEPENPDTWSRPDGLLQHEVVHRGPLSPGSGTFTETLIRDPDPVLGEALYSYNAELMFPFPQEADTVYWLKIVALEDNPEDGLMWGWHNRDYTVPNPLASPNVIPGERVVGVLPDGTEIWHHQDDAVQGFSVQFGLEEVEPGVVHEYLFEDFESAVPVNYVPNIDGPYEIGYHSKDLAFALYTIPEPGTLAFLALGGIGGLTRMLYRRRRRLG